jgi:hypothetical protein
MEIVKILDASIGVTGPNQTVSPDFLRTNVPMRFHAKLGSGDKVTVWGRASAAHDWDVLHEFEDETPADIYLSAQIRATLSTDGGSSPRVALLHAQNQWGYLELTAHTA